jgi:hypothetical protein
MSEVKIKHMVMKIEALENSIKSIPKGATYSTEICRDPSIVVEELRMLVDALEAEREKYAELVSYLPKLPTQPYEKQLAQELQAERHKLAICDGSNKHYIKEYETAGAVIDSYRKQLSVLNTEFLAERARSKKYISLLKSSYGFVKAGDNVGITEAEIRQAIAEYESSAK